MISAFAFTGVILEIIFQQGPNTGLNLLSYFTIQSNLIVGSALAFNVYYRSETPQWLNILKSGALIWILVTGLVFHFLLSQLYHPVGIPAYSNIILHYIVPAAVLFNWIIFEIKGTLRHSFTFIWIGYPSVYALLSLLRGLADGFYPYWFVNPWKPYPDGAGSLLNVVIVVIVLAVIFSIIGNLLVLLDRFMKKIQQN
jgi:hypothetical protein